MTAHGEPLLERLARGPLLGDGAMGTLLYARLGTTNATICFDDLNSTRPELVQAIHQDYITAGAEVIETNTFGANGVKLGRHGLGDQVRAINMRGVKLAREAREVAGRPVFVAGSVGPAGLPIAQTEDETALRALFREQIDALLEGGVDLLILETFSQLAELRAALGAARDACDLPVFAQMTFADDGQLLGGEAPGEVVRALATGGATGIGVNCGMGPAGTLDVATEMAAALNTLPPGVTRPWLSAQPNAGQPARVEGRYLYVSTPEYFTDYARRFVEVGVRLVGGCCGTTPRHVAAMRVALAEVAPATPTLFAPPGRPASPKTSAGPTITLPSLAKERGRADEGAMMPDPGTPTRWQQALAEKRFVVSVELDPPKGLNPGKVLAGAEMLRRRGVEFINIADSPTARVRMSSLSLARLLHDLLDIEPIIHCTTRDRNLMALQADLLGAHALGLRNILALTGDPLRVGDYPNLTGVWNIDAVGLVSVLRGMNAGHDAGGSPLGGQASFFIGAALDVNVGTAPIDLAIEQARNKVARTAEAIMTEQDLEFSRFSQKIAAGAHYIMTQFIYDLEPLRQFYARFGQPPVPIVLGLSPLHSYKHAEFLHNEVRGITIPLAVRERMRAAGERGREVGLEIAYELLSTARDEGLIQGCYLLPSYGRYDLVAELATALIAPHAPEQVPA